MSVRVMTWVFQSSRATGSDRLVLLAIADRTNDEGEDAWPSLSAIAAKARVDERTVRRCLLRLEALGELTIRRRSGRRSVYGIVMQEALPLSPEPTSPGVAPTDPAPSAARPRTICPPGQSVRGDNLSPRAGCPPTPDTGVRGVRTSSTSKSTHTPRARARRATARSTPRDAPQQKAGTPEGAGAVSATPSETNPPAPGRSGGIDPSAGAGGAAAAQLATPIGARSEHRSHASCLNPCCVPATLHRELMRKSGLANEDEADTQLRAWYRQVGDAWAGRAVGEDDFAFWRARWKERTRTRAPTVRCRAPAPDGVWGEIFEGLLLELGRYQAEQWFRAARVVRDAGEVLTVAVPDDLHRDWIESHFRDLLTRRAEAARPGLRVDLVVEEAA